MRGDYRSWFFQNQQSPSFLGASPDLEKQDTSLTLTIPGTGLVSPGKTTCVYSVPELPLPHTRVDQVNEPQGWFYCLPYSRQEILPSLNYTLPKEEHVAAPSVDHNGTILPGQKKFLVFDRSGDRTTLIFSSGITTPVQQFTSCNANAKPVMTCNLDKEYPEAKQGVNVLSERPLGDGYVGNEVRSEMHEDTEELNALLYSTSDDLSDYTEDDDEVTSTGHSPILDKPGQFEGSAEEVASSDSYMKKRKLMLTDTATSTKVITGNSDYENDDAESTCNLGHIPIDSEPSNKRLRKERVRETICILQKIIPGGVRGENAVVVLDKAIQYLKFLKHKAKTLGLDDALQG